MAPRGPSSPSEPHVGVLGDGLFAYSTTKSRKSSGGGPEDFAEYLGRMGPAQDDRVAWTREGGKVVVRQHSWRRMQGVSSPPPARPGRSLLRVARARSTPGNLRQNRGVPAAFASARRVKL